MKDIKFRLSLPRDFKEDIHKYEQNPSCPCNLPIYKKVLREARNQLAAYYPGKEIVEAPSDEEEIQQLMQNNFSVINCTASELETKLRNLPPGRKQIAVARFEDKVTVIVNELDVVF